jgi:hypothetical protein
MKNKLPFIIIGLLILFFAFSAYKVMSMRFVKGDVYPQYSSLRHDPMGTSIFFQSLKKMGYRVETIMEEKLPENVNPQNTILFYLSPSFYISKDAREEIISFILGGGRVFVSDKHNNRLLSFFDTKIVYLENDNNEQEYDNNEQEYERNAIPEEIFDFANERLKVFNKSTLKCNWSKSKTVYKLNEQDIILLLNHGKGNIIISSETYFISNESLVKEPPVKFLTWIMNGRKRVLVDEFHHGISYKKGISFLLKKYNLYWFIAYLILIFFLYLWYVLPYFRTPLPRPSRGNYQTQTSLRGYTQLLTKTIPKNKLLDISIDQWIKGSKNRFFMEKNKKEIERIKTKTELTNIDKDEELISKYNEISNIIKERKTLWKIQPR